MWGKLALLAAAERIVILQDPMAPFSVRRVHLATVQT
jgi:hypothetical protein